MDGTLLNHEHSLSDYTCQVLQEAQDRGILLVLASGRSIRTLAPLGEKLAMHEHQGYYLCVNGEKIISSKSLEEFTYQQLFAKDIQKIMEFVEPFEVEIMAVQDVAIYDYIPASMLELKNEYRRQNHITDDIPNTAGTFSMIVDQRKGYDVIEYLHDIHNIQIQANKICIAHEPEVLNNVYEKLLQHFKDEYHFVKTSPRWIECMPKGVDKAVALDDLMKKLQLTPDEIMIFGDGENDLSMFEKSTYAIAMKNGMEKVLEKANFVTEKTNDEDGVAHFIEAYVLHVDDRK